MTVLAPSTPPAPQPVVRMRLASDSLFNFDRATIKPDGRGSLEKLASDLRGLSYDSIQVMPPCSPTFQ